VSTILLVGKRAYGTGSLTIRNGQWFARWRDEDGQHSRMLGFARAGGSRDGMSKRDAEAKLREILLAAETAATRPVERARVSELTATYLAGLERNGRKPSHIRSSGYHVSTWIDPFLGELEAHTLDERDVRRLIDRMIRAGRAPKMIRNVLGTLHGVLQIAVDRRMLDRNPCTAVQGPVVRPATDIRFLTGPEIARLLDAAPGDSTTQAERDQWPVVRLLVLTAVSSGLRLGELRGLRWQDLDTGAMKIRVRHSYVHGILASPKSRRSVRTVPLSAELMSELNAHHKTTPWNADTDYVLAHPHTGNPLSETRLREHYSAALKRADVRPVRVHDLRHTFATLVAASGEVSIRTLQEWMGHESITTTQRYADYFPGHDEAAQLDRALGTQFSTQSPPTLQSEPAVGEG
jgi:integrase